jgi:hypothetical protein
VRSTIALLCGALVTASTAQARPIDFDRPEAWSLEYFASASLLTELGPPPSSPIHLGVEVDWLPPLGQMQNDVGYIGIKTEALNRTPVIARPRLAIGLPQGFSLQLAWVPPVYLNGARANLLSFSASRAFKANDFTLSVTALGQVGDVKGDFTCAQSVIDDPALNTFGCTEKSHDVARLDYAGLAVTAAYRIAAARGLTPYASVHLTYMNLGLDVNAHYGGMADTNSLQTQGVTFATATGVSYTLWSRLDLSCEAFYSPLLVKQAQGGDTIDGLFNLRALISVRLW